MLTIVEREPAYLCPLPPLSLVPACQSTQERKKREEEAVDMRRVAILLVACLLPARAFVPCNTGSGAAPTPVATRAQQVVQRQTQLFSASPVAETSIDEPANLPSEAGIDYVPLATMLATGDFKAADQFTRDALIQAAGEGSRKRGFVYWTDVKNIPNTDLRTMEKLWLRHSGGKFGYSVQRDVWNRSRGDFEMFCRRIGWTTKDAETERKLRWFGANEFVYDLERAVKGHLPLTSALRGTQLIKELVNHPLWETNWQDE